MLPPNHVRRFLAAVLTLAAAGTCLADITLAPLFRDGAVLQRDQPLVIWGRAGAAEKVEVKFGGQTESVIASADGRWRVTLKPLKASGQPAELVAAGANEVRVRDVVVGDVWLCSGQSNMAWLVRNSLNAETETAAADFPLIRQFKVPTAVAEKPTDDVTASWTACAPSSVGNFSAVAYFFAREMHQKLGVPIGLVNSSWGGTQIESWLSEAALAKIPSSEEIYGRWEKMLAEFPEKQREHEAANKKWETDRETAKSAGKQFARKAPPRPEGPGSRWMPAGIYNAMIAPLVPSALRGVLWYQGESNASRHDEYAALFTGMITQWRADFRQPDLPFYFVQLANYEAGTGNVGDMWSFLREAQARALALPATGMAVTIDIGDPKDIHPKNKQEVGRRLALHARAQIFGEKIETDGPTFRAARREGNALRVSFGHAAGLKVEPSKEDGRASFEIAGENQKFVPATVRVDGRTLLISADAVPEPVAVRYAWRNSPEARIFNNAGLPAAPFRSDKWK